jgi:adenylyl cyclase-associated protein
MSVQNLETLVKRLETVTARLEAVSTTNKPALAPKPGSTTGGASPASSAPPPSVLQYDDAIDESLKNFFSLSGKIGGDIGSIAPKVRQVFDNLRNYIWFAAGTSEPSVEVIKSKLQPMQQVIEEIGAFKDSKRNTDHFNHLSAVNEGLPAVFWVSVKPTPAPFVKEAFEASMFYVNRVRKDYKGKAEHEDWVKAWIEIFNEMQKYVRQVHTTGVVYNSAPGSSPPSSSSTTTTPSKPAAGGPPPPPPPPPANIFADIKKDSAPSGDKDERAALFAEINKGENITSKLKKVTADMQTHKNPNLRAANVVPASASKTSDGKTAAAAQAVQKPPRTELENYKNWAVEYHKGNREIVINATDMKQTVYIFKCENSVVQIKGKVNSITVDGCKKTSIAFENLLGQVEVINSQSIEVQTLGSLPTISIQKTDGCQVYLSKDSLDAEIVTSKSSAMNILVPCGEEGDFSEFPIPEQFKTTFNKETKKLETTVSDIV